MSEFLTIGYWLTPRCSALPPQAIVPLQQRIIGISADHGGYALKQYLGGMLRGVGYEVKDFGDNVLIPGDDYPDFTVPLARAVGFRQVALGISICGSGVGAAIVANKIPGVRACLIHEAFSAHQGVEDDDLNLICLGGLVVGQALAWDLVQIFLAAHFRGEERHHRRIDKITALESRGYIESTVDAGTVIGHAE